MRARLSVDALLEVGASGSVDVDATGAVLAAVSSMLACCLWWWKTELQQCRGGEKQRSRPGLTPRTKLAE